MQQFFRMCTPGLALLGVLALLVTAGCGGGGGVSDPVIPVQDPVEISTEPTAIGGTLYSFHNGIIDEALNAEVTLAGVPDDSSVTFTPRTTRSLIRGGYRFTDLPAGRYEVRATVQSPYDPTIVLKGSISGVRARGNIPSLMINMLLCSDDDKAAFTGAITAPSGQPAAEAVVSVEVDAYSTERLQNPASASTKIVILSSNADANGQYRIDIPAGAISYYVAAHNATSMVSDSGEITSLAAGEVKTVNLQLTAAEKPVFDELLLDIVSTTLPEASAKASDQALVTRLAVARVLGASPDRLSRLEKMAKARQSARSRALGSIIENDLYWPGDYADVGVQGFKVYRATQLNGPYTLTGTVRDPYQFSFFDNDPSLTLTESVYYRVASYAANAKVSPLSHAVVATPLAPVTGASPADGTEVAQAEARLSWDIVPGAKSYMVLVYKAMPTFNDIPEFYKELATEISTPISTLAPGEYWWSVSAYNAEDPGLATAVSYSPYVKVKIK